MRGDKNVKGEVGSKKREVSESEEEERMERKEGV